MHTDPISSISLENLMIQAPKIIFNSMCCQMVI